ncbi:DEAD/DEAH box helicase family protein, partial [Elusimicrobiota bacterium]
MDDLNKAIQEIARLREENSNLKQQLGLAVAEPPVAYVTKSGELPLQAPALPTVHSDSPSKEKITLFRTLFRGREDVYAVYWSNERTGKKGYAPACEDPWAARKGQPKKYLPLIDDVVSQHLTGRNIIGVFPLLQDNTCWFLAGDFDKEGWQLDAVAFLEVCRRHHVPAYLERSRSGNGGHTWIFFSSPVSAMSARQLGMRLLRQTMDARGDMDLGSYDRFFPNQDFLPRGGFGNLIAAPLQKKPRVLGNTEFLDHSTPEMQPWPDQWAFLSGINRLTPPQLEALLETIPPIEIGPRASRRVSKTVRAKHPAPAKIRCELGATVSIEKSGIPPWMSSKLKHLASMHNPEFYNLERLRYSTYRTPRFIKCYREDFSHYHLPRGTYERIREIAQEAGSELIFTDRRPKLEGLTLRFHGSLIGTQKRAAKAVLSHDIGVLVAPPGAGKTVMGCYAVAKRNIPTLILSHRKLILEQWRKQLMALLDLPSAEIGQFGGGRDRQTGIVDLAMLQSLARHDDLTDFFSRYGLIIVDECHHIPAATFEACLREANVRYVLGLTATPYRRDKLQDIITLECGPVRFRMDEA